MNTYDVIVIGGGHAGAEAAWAAARLGARTALVTMRLDAIARMSCNPAIGGLGKGQMVREIDALGGLMGLAIDATGIQFRVLNKSKGPAVWAPRAQADRQSYAAEVRRLLAETANLELIEGTVESVLTAPVCGSGQAQARVTGIALEDGRRLGAHCVVITTGTFMRSLMLCGRTLTRGGRVGEVSSRTLSASLEALGLTLGRLKTGTPPRVHRDSVNYDALQDQLGDDCPLPFSFLNQQIDRRQVRCWITYTNAATHDLIREHLHEAPMYTGQIRSRGPRYCPSIEDKVVRFADKPRHPVFLEPEGYDSEQIYCNGIATSLPAQVQQALVHTIAGLEHATILQHGYAVEYDFVPTHQTKVSLEAKAVNGLFFAGQVNGTSGYEEAAAQGLVAGVNAVHTLDGREPLVLRRDQAYVGVMIDDLVTKPPSEPYRMFTSRAEYRLRLRSDNADQRLTPLGRRLGLVDDRRWATFQDKVFQVNQIGDFLVGRTHNGKAVADWLRRTDVTLAVFERWLHRITDAALHACAIEQVFIEAKYAGYIARQQRHIDRFGRMESLPIPGDVDFGRIRELRLEAREQLARIRPQSLGQAARISGINPSDITVLWVALSRSKPERQQS